MKISYFLSNAEWYKTLFPGHAWGEFDHLRKKALENGKNPERNTTIFDYYTHGVNSYPAPLF